MPESIGKHIAQLRQEHGWTQESLAARLAISRVAVSHIEMDLSIPSERTITLLAGLFKLTPHGLVEGTTYPAAKVDRLPLVVCTYTQIELELILLEQDLKWLARLEGISNWEKLQAEIRNYWCSRLAQWNDKGTDYWRPLEEREKEMLNVARQKIDLLWPNIPNNQI